MEIVRARPGQAEALTSIAMAAKAHWGYPQRWMEEWRSQLTITAPYVAAHPTFAAIIDGHAVGFCAVAVHDADAVLDHLWVVPAMMQRGVGRALFLQAETAARDAGAAHLTIVADPNAAAFYERMGAKVAGSEPASVDGCERHLPVFRKRL